MKFTPRQIAENYNISRTHPLVDFLWLVGGLFIIAGMVYFSLGLITDLVVPKVPLSVENWLGRHALERFETKHDPYIQSLLDTLVSELPEDSPLRGRSFDVYLTPNTSVNAIALPGGHILIFSGLLDTIESENELVMVLGHELGHFAHRDHLRGLGRGLGVSVATLLLFGRDSATSELVSNTLLTFNGKYSRDQETAADSHGLAMLVNHYGHAGGAVDFFARLAEKSPSGGSYLLASHPDPQDRIAELRREISDSGYYIEKAIKLPAIQNLIEK